MAQMRLRTRPFSPHAFTHEPANEWEENLFNVFNGGLDKARIGRVPYIAAKAIGAHTSIVYVKKGVVQKIRGKHHIDYTEFHAVADAFQTAEIIRDTRTTVVFLFPSPRRNGRTLNIVVKSANHGTELWVKTMFTAGKKHIKKLRAKAMVLRG